MAVTKSVTSQSFEGRDFWCLKTSQDEKLQERVCFEKSDDIERGKGWLSVLQWSRLQTGPFNEVWPSNRRTIENAIKRFGLDVNRLLGPNPKEKLDAVLLDSFLPECLSADEGLRSTCFNRFRSGSGRCPEDPFTKEDLVSMATLPGGGVEDPSIMVRRFALSAVGECGNKMDAKDIQKIYPLVEKAFRDSSPEIRAAAIGALVGLDPERAWQRLTTEGLKDSKEGVRVSAHWALGKYAEHPYSEKYAVPAYQIALRGAEDSSTPVQAGAYGSLGKLGVLVDPNETFNQVVQKGIVAVDRGVQSQALETLKSLKLRYDDRQRELVLHVFSQVPGRGLFTMGWSIQYQETAWDLYTNVATTADYLSLLRNDLSNPFMLSSLVYDRLLDRLFEESIFPEVFGDLVGFCKNYVGRVEPSGQKICSRLILAGQRDAGYRDRFLDRMRDHRLYREWSRDLGVPIPEEKTPPASSAREEGCECHAAGAMNHHSWMAGVSAFLKRR